MGQLGFFPVVDEAHEYIVVTSTSITAVKRLEGIFDLWLKAADKNRKKKVEGDVLLFGILVIQSRR